MGAVLRAARAGARPPEPRGRRQPSCFTAARGDATTARWELRLGRDDLAEPYHVQEAFEGITGAISSRWYERIWRGPDHFALEIHRLPDLSIRFTVAAPTGLESAIRGPLEDLYPDVELIEVDGQPAWASCVVRLKKRASFVLSIQTTRNYEHAFTESLVAMLSTVEDELSVQLVLTPAPGLIHRRARRLLKRRERTLQHADTRDPGELGIDSIVEAKELKGALELQHRSLLYFDLRVTGHDPQAVRRVAGLFSQLRSENELVRREMRLRRRVYASRIAQALPNPLPGWRAGVLSTSELATLWQLPRARVKHARLPRATVRRAIAPPEIAREPARMLLRDERGPVSIAAADRKYGHALIGGQGGGKSSVLARHFANDARDPDRAVVLIDPKGPLAELCLGLVPAGRTVHYLDLGHPEIGINPLTINASPGARAAVFLHALIEANPPGAIQAASDSFLRQAVAAVCAVERTPTLWHVYRLLESGHSPYRESVARRLAQIPGNDFARHYWRREFPALLADRGFAASRAQPAAQQARTPDLHPRDRHAPAPPRHARPRRHPRTRRGAHPRRRQSHRRRGQHRARQPAAAAAPAPRPPSPPPPARRPTPARLAADRRGPQRAHPVGREDARRRPLRRTRGRLRVAVLGADPRRGHPLRRALAAAVDLDLPHARNGRRPLTRRPGDGGLLRPHLHRPRRTRTTPLLPRRHHPAPHPPRAEPLGRPRRPARRLPRPHPPHGATPRRTTSPADTRERSASAAAHHPAALPDPLAGEADDAGLPTPAGARDVPQRTAPARTAAPADDRTERRHRDPITATARRCSCRSPRQSCGTPEQLEG